jgi:putative flippase GtrA
MTFGLEKFITNKEVIRFIVFNVLAVIRTILDILVWRFLVWCFQPEFKITKFFEKFKLNRYAISQGISFIIASFVSYYSNKIITFDDEKEVSLQSILYFILISVVSLVISVWMMEWLTSDKKIQAKIANYKMLVKYWPLLAKIATIVVTLFINYFGQKYLVFVG